MSVRIAATLVTSLRSATTPSVILTAHASLVSSAMVSTVQVSFAVDGCR